MLLAAATASAQVPVPEFVADDARTLARVAEMSRGDLPRDLMRRIVDDDIERLRMPRPDGTYQYAAHERMEGGRIADGYSIQRRKDDQLAKLELKGDLVYRLIISVPARRLLVSRNRRLFVDRAEIEFIPQGSSAARVQNVPIGAWLEPGTSRSIDIEQIARQATVRVFARADRERGSGNLSLTLLRARIFDLPESPWAAAVTSAKGILRALDGGGDPKSIRSLALRMESELRPVQALTPPPSNPPPAAGLPPEDVESELQMIEDLLTGSESERREGLDRLHQLIRRIRSR